MGDLGPLGHRERQHELRRVQQLDRQAPTDLTYLGLGPMLSYDPRALLAGGVIVLTPNTSPDIPAKAYRTTEHLMTAYVQADLKAQLGAAELTGNIGVQAVGTEQKSRGLVYNGTGYTNITQGDDYWDILPSANLSLRLPSDWVFRLAAARQMMRPRFDDMRVALSYGFDAQQGLISGVLAGKFRGSVRPEWDRMILDKLAHGEAATLARNSSR